MIKFLKILMILVLVTLLGLIGWLYFYTKSITWPENMNFGEYRPYILGTEIDFSKSGNSAEFVSTDNGWGGQEKKFRCTVGKNTTTKLYIKNGANKDMELKFEAFGIYPEVEGERIIDVYANEKKIKTITLVEKGIYTAKIPSEVMSNDKLDLRFYTSNPYKHPGGNRKLGMAVHSIKISNDYGLKTKRKIARWIKNNLFTQDKLEEYYVEP